MTGLNSGKRHAALAAKCGSEDQDMHLKNNHKGRNTLENRRFRVFALSVFSLSQLIATAAFPQPHSVPGIEADEVLNIRADIDLALDADSTEVLGVIPHDASDVMVTGVSVETGGTTWRKIKYQGIVGWVNAGNLKPTSLMLEAPKALECAGTEPFWHVTIDNSDSAFGWPELEDEIQLEYLRNVPGLGRTDLWAHYLASTDDTYALTVIVRYTESCFDGMSGLTYDFEALLLGMGASGAPAYGCCSIMH